MWLAESSATSYHLPTTVEQQVLEVARRSHLLLVGELHGTREVPSLVAGLLPRLKTLGYRGLGLEVPRDQQAALLAWADGRTQRPPTFYARPSRDGRGNVETLELVKFARTAGYQLLCFDQTAEQPMQRWADRDGWMAYNLLEEWAAICAGQRVVAVCGSLHARLTPEGGVGRLLRKAVSGGQQLWPSLAGWVRQQQPGLAAGALDVRFVEGTFFNMGERTIFRRPVNRTEAWAVPAEPAFTLAVWLPRATPATFLSQPV